MRFIREYMTDLLSRLIVRRLKSLEAIGVESANIRACPSALRLFLRYLGDLFPLFSGAGSFAMQMAHIDPFHGDAIKPITIKGTV